VGNGARGYRPFKDRVDAALRRLSSLKLNFHCSHLQTTIIKDEDVLLLVFVSFDLRNDFLKFDFLQSSKLFDAWLRFVFS